MHNIQKALGKLHRKRALKSVLSVIFTSSDSDGLFVLSTSHTTSSISSLNHNHYETGLTRNAEINNKKITKLKATRKRGINSVLHFASKAIWYFTASKLLNTETDRGSSTVCQSKKMFYRRFPLTPKNYYKIKLTKKSRCEFSPAVRGY